MVSTIFIITNRFQYFLSLRAWCMCVCVLFIYTISISIIRVSWEESSLVTSNQQIYDFYKWIIFEKKRHCGKYIFDIIELLIQSRKFMLWAHTSWCEYMFTWLCHSAAPNFVACFSVLVISNQSTSKKPHVSDLAKLDTLLYKTHIKVPLVLRYQHSTCVDPELN